MQSYLMDSICKTGIFIICAQVLIHFRPKASYEKYLKMLVSAMILVQLFAPIGELFAEGGEQNFAESVSRFEEELSMRLENSEDVTMADEEAGTNEETELNGDAIVDIPVQEITMDKITIQIGEGGRQDAAN